MYPGGARSLPSPWFPEWAFPDGGGGNNFIGEIIKSFFVLFQNEQWVHHMKEDPATQGEYRLFQFFFANFSLVVFEIQRDKAFLFCFISHYQSVK